MYVIKNMETGEYWNGDLIELDTTPDIQKAKELPFKPKYMCEGEKAVEVDVIIKEREI